MIIGSPEISVQSGETRIEARVEIEKSSGQDLPQSAWFSVPEEHTDLLTDHLEGFVSALLLVAMQLGEDIEVRGTLSPRFAVGLEEEYQKFFHLWFPDRYQMVEVKPDCYEVCQRSDGVNVLAPFSAGVDSFYTLWRTLPWNEARPGLAASHLLHVIGFDVVPGNEEKREELNRSHAQFAEKLSLQYVPMRTNIRYFTNKLMGSKSWHFCHGSVLIGCALLLSRGVTRLYVPAGRTYTNGAPCGSLPAIDHCLSTETLEVYHHGAGLKRIEKTRIIADWPETYSRLRVCWAKQKGPGLGNCCRCDKCVRTMVALEIAGRLERYETFPLPLESRHIREHFRSEIEGLYLNELIEEAEKSGRHDLASDLRYALQQRDDKQDLHSPAK